MVNKSAYAALPVDEDAEAEDAPTAPAKMELSTSSKLAIAKPLFLPYMLPLFFVYMAEYTINQGVSPNLLYPIPDRSQHPILGRLIHKLSDYYPLWQVRLICA